MFFKYLFIFFVFFINNNVIFADNIVNKNYSKIEKNTIIKTDNKQENGNKDVEKTAKNEKNIVDKNNNHSLFLFMYFGAYGLSFETGYYYKNFIGFRADIEAGFIPSFGLTKMTLCKGQYLMDKGSAVENDDNLVDAKFREKIYGLYFSIKPWKGAFHIDIGMSHFYSKTIYTIKANNYDFFREYSGYSYSFSNIHHLGLYFGCGWDINLKLLRISIIVGTMHYFNIHIMETIIPERMKSHDDQKYLFLPQLKVGIGYQFDLPF